MREHSNDELWAGLASAQPAITTRPPPERAVAAAPEMAVSEADPDKVIEASTVVAVKETGLPAFGLDHAQPQPCINADATPPAQILSSKPLADWRGSLTTLDGFTGTRPVVELEHVEWPEVSNLVRPEEPAILADKKRGQYFLPCLLKVAPLVGNTLEYAIQNGEPTTGRMRSKSHVTEADLLVIDVDGLSEADFMAGLGKIASDGVTCLAYTTHSHGREDKPGIRARLAIPLDRPLNIEDYATAWRGFDAKYFGGAAGKADSSGANLYQQQGTWCCHPDRADKAESWTHSGGVASADVLFEIGRVAQPVRSAAVAVAAAVAETFHRPPSSGAEYPDSDADKVADACNQIGMFRNTKGADQSEPLWRDCLGVVGHCVDGEITCHEWSGGHAKYNETATNKKLAYRLKTAPTTCDQLRKTNPAGCSGCRQRCRSPITLGWPVSDVFSVIGMPEVSL